MVKMNMQAPICLHLTILCISSSWMAGEMHHQEIMHLQSAWKRCHCTMLGMTLNANKSLACINSEDGWGAAFEKGEIAWEDGTLSEALKFFHHRHELHYGSSAEELNAKSSPTTQELTRTINRDWWWSSNIGEGMLSKGSNIVKL